MQIHSPTTVPTPHRVVELDRLGDEIAELSAHLDAATARLLELIRAFDARGGWNTGFRSCASWLSWRVGLDLGAARAGGGGAAPAGRGCGPREPVSADPGAGQNCHRLRKRFRRNAHTGPAAGGCSGPARGDGPASRP